MNKGQQRRTYFDGSGCRRVLTFTRGDEKHLSPRAVVRCLLLCE